MKNLVLVLNCGSSSVKFAVLDPASGEQPLSGNAERLEQSVGQLNTKHLDTKARYDVSPASHEKALELIVQQLESLGLMDKIQAVGHRVVHGGEFFSASTLIDDNVRSKIADCCKLAPLHNPAHLTGIDAAKRVFANLPHVAVFDTAFHQQMPEKAYLYALPYEYYENFNIRRYGFHGTSFRYIASTLSELTGISSPKAIVCHLGNGGSVAAIDGDKSLDTTMGLTPLEGLVHGTRSGDIDPAIPQILVDQFGVAADDMSDILWKKSGLLGLSQLSNDCRELESAYEEGHEGAIRALSVYSYKLAKHIAAQMVALNGCDVLVFTGGIGENSTFLRKKTIEQLAFLGFTIDDNKNEATVRGKQGSISIAASKPIWVIPTNEELMIARDTLAIINH